MGSARRPHRGLGQQRRRQLPQHCLVGGQQHLLAHVRREARQRGGQVRLGRRRAGAGAAARRRRLLLLRAAARASGCCPRRAGRRPRRAASLALVHHPRGTVRYAARRELPSRL